jgi:hypothetical protein
MIEKNTPVDTAVPEFWNVERIPEATPRYFGGHAAHDRRGVGGGEHATAYPVRRDQHGEHPVGKVDWQHHEADEAAGEHHHASRRHAASAEAIRERTGQGTGDEKADGEG